MPLRPPRPTPPPGHLSCFLLKHPLHVERNPNKHPRKYPGDVLDRGGGDVTTENYEIKPWYDQAYYVPDQVGRRLGLGKAGVVTLVRSVSVLTHPPRPRATGGVTTESLI